MTREELIESLKLLKEQARHYWANTFIWSINIDSFKFVIDSTIKVLEQEPCEDTISRKSIKQKLQEHHDFFVNAYGGFSNLPQNDKSRVDEITNCIAMVVNEPSVTPQEPRKGHWITVSDEETLYCSECNLRLDDEQTYIPLHYCPNCGANMREVEE